MSKPGRILNKSWVCRLGCYHEPFDSVCQCECHNYLSNVITERNYSIRQATLRGKGN